MVAESRIHELLAEASRFEADREAILKDAEWLAEEHGHQSAYNASYEDWAVDQQLKSIDEQLAEIYRELEELEDEVLA